MRPVILQEFISVDGMVSGPAGSVDFIPASTRNDDVFGVEQREPMDAVDTMLLGRVTYQLFAGYWPHVTEGPEREFADKFNGLNRVVFSRSLTRGPWGNWQESTVVGSGDVAGEVRRLQGASGKGILISGSISLAQALIDADLVDEYRLVVCPVLLGSGRPLFKGGGISLPLTLQGATNLSRGGVSLAYRRRRDRRQSGYAR
jgi:dihydrofolate reductase